MPNLKDIRRRIKSVKSTQKITQAMRMVSAAKVKRAEGRLKAAKPYLQTLRALVSDVSERLAQAPDLLAKAKYGAMLSGSAARAVKTIGMVVISSDRGLCGAYNTNVIRAALHQKKTYEAQGVTVKLYLVGNKAIQTFARLGVQETDLIGRMANMTAAPSVADARLVTDNLIEAYQTGLIDQVVVHSTLFKSLISYQVEQTSLIPTQPVSAAAAAPEKRATTAELLLEPSPQAVLDGLMPMYLQQTLYGMLLEAATSELAARMTAMANASSNASDMLNRLTLVYNKARQSSITQEILEVVSGAEALR
ncbi:MAG: ATP synthase F1 subunit gamma [Vampirovibrionales bacterium]|nr:ATP synthase F1 subunit gamma [Vampirovibrionales bacterium]